MGPIFEVAVIDTDDTEHSCLAQVDEYIKPLPATQWEPAQHEAVEWTFCDEKGRFIMPTFEISDREDRRIEELLIEKIRELRNGEES